MRFSWRLGLRLFLLVIAFALLWVRFNSLRRTKSPETKPTTDLSVTMPLNQPGGSEVPAESYDVYSALYQTPMDEPLAFAEDSQTDIPQVDGSCLRPATATEHLMLDAFVAANRQSHRWEKKFSIPEGYQLLSKSEVSLAQHCLLTHWSDASQCEKYRQLRHLRLLGVPGFDSAHTRALVSVAKSCGVHCGSGGVFAVEKRAGKWQRSETTDFNRDCSWMY